MAVQVTVKSVQNAMVESVPGASLPAGAERWMVERFSEATLQFVAGAGAVGGATGLGGICACTEEARKRNAAAVSFMWDGLYGHTNRVPDADRPAFHDARRHAAMPAHRGIGAGAYLLFHPRTGRARPDDLQQRATHANARIAQREEVDNAPQTGSKGKRRKDMGRNLVVCCDGTWNTPQQTDRGVNVPSNVVKMARAVAEGADQVIYYDTGIGTTQGLDKWTGGALGIGLTENIKEAYAWIAKNLQPDDRLFLFGFSRGAYTVRSIGGLIGRCGLSTADPKEVDTAYELYRKAGDSAGQQRAAEFKGRQRHPGIHFLGVWDTVGSLGVPAISRYGLLRKVVRKLTDNTAFAHGFHDETLGRHVSHAYHALALDERRGAFEPAVWKSSGESRENVEQVWFAGAHCNVGGGYVDSGLSDHAFMWMAVKAIGAGLQLDERYLSMRADPNAHGELRDEHVGLYKVLPEYERPLCLPDTLNEKIHASVLKRSGNPTNDYHPANIKMNALPPVTDVGLALIEELRRKLYGPPAVAVSPV